jgi:hypothetical protein
MKTPEAKVKDEIKAYLKSIGAYYFMPVQTGYGATTVDILVCHEGKFMAIEIKAPKAGQMPEPSARQKLVLEQVNDAFGRAYCVDSLDMLKSCMRRSGFVIVDLVKYDPLQI